VGLLLAHDPDLLILDDFSMGLDPGYRRLFVEYLKEYASAEGKTIFLTSHIIQDMEMLIDDCIILDYGRILIHQPTKEIMDTFRRFRFSSEVPEMYLNGEKGKLNPLVRCLDFFLTCLR
jgi:ABC-2 type transport system ATP-binding protein